MLWRLQWVRAVSIQQKRSACQVIHHPQYFPMEELALVKIRLASFWAINYDRSKDFFLWRDGRITLSG
jgi:hypothetical protein